MPIPERDRYRLAADIGGTFTDIVLLAPDGEYWIKKVSSTPSDYARGITDGVVELLADRGLDGDALLEIIHGTTIAGNAVLESKGAKTALITTRGFRDVLELRRLRVSHLYDVFYEPPKPLVERRLRLEVDERIGASGDIVQPLDEASVYAAVERIRNEGAQTQIPHLDKRKTSLAPATKRAKMFLDQEKRSPTRCSYYEARLTGIPVRAGEGLDGYDGAVRPDDVRRVDASSGFEVIGRAPRETAGEKVRAGRTAR